MREGVNYFDCDEWHLDRRIEIGPVRIANQKRRTVTGELRRFVDIQHVDVDDSRNGGHPSIDSIFGRYRQNDARPVVCPIERIHNNYVSILVHVERILKIIIRSINSLVFLSSSFTKIMRSGESKNKFKNVACLSYLSWTGGCTN